VKVRVQKNAQFMEKPPKGKTAPFKIKRQEQQSSSLVPMQTDSDE